MSMQRMFKKLRFVNPVVVARDGIEALEILRNSDNLSGLKQPFILILDLNMPRMSGHELMDEIRSDPQLSDTIVFIMSTSNFPHDIEKAYKSHTAGYILKDGNPESFRNALELLGTYSEIVRLPFPDATLKTN
jgi:CheY-like chemotaxis protein